MSKVFSKKNLSLILIPLFILFLIILSFFDNKYTIKPPLPQDNILTLTGENLASRPVFLIDEWLISDGINAPPQQAESSRTWIGEFSNYQRNNPKNRSPYGSCTYQLQIRYLGDPMIAGLYFPDLCNKYFLWWDNELIGNGYSRFHKNILLEPGIHTITLAVTSTSGYYSGMYFPGAIGSDDEISTMINIQTVLYGIAMLIPTLLAIFCFSLWSKTKSPMKFNLAMFCISFALSLSYYFIQLFNSPITSYRFLISDLATYMAFYFAMMLLYETTESKQKTPARFFKWVAIGFPTVELFLYFISNIWNQAIYYHGLLQNTYRILLFICLCFGLIYAVKERVLVSKLVLLCNFILGIGIISNLISSNQFEPAYTLWQYEWSSLLLVILFGCLMEEENKKIISENDHYKNHLEELVELRTSQLSYLLDERRAFFSDMAHDLKAPLSSMKAFIEMIRLHNIGVDNELEMYLSQVDHWQNEMTKRLNTLNEINAADKLSSTFEYILLSDLFKEFYRTHNPEATVMGIHFLINVSEKPVTIWGQRDKLLLALENLFYNALRFTPEEGKIILDAIESDTVIEIRLKDTGCGISPEDLPHIFERFYTGTLGKQTGGSGLGLYIVKMILDEMNAEIQVESKISSGTIFTVLFKKHQ